MSNTKQVRDFIAAWEARDIEAVIGAFTEDTVYHNIPMAPLKGKAQIREFVAPFLAMTTRVEWRVIAIAEAADGAVLTERVDTFHMANGKTIAIPVMGTFELEAGKIAAWRDYFDLADFQRQMA